MKEKELTTRAINSFERNISLYKYYLALSGALFIWPIELIYLQSKGLSFTQIMLIESVVSIGQIVMEIPSGIIADYIGCKKTVLIGIISQIIAYSILVLSKTSFNLFLYGFILACGYAMVSGADTALLYDSHKILKREDDYKKTIANAGSLKMWVLAFVTLISGKFYKINPDLPYILSICFLVTSLCILFFCKEVPRDNKGEKKGEIYKEVGLFFKNKILIQIVCFSTLFSCVFSDSNYALQAYMKKMEVDLDFYGVVFFVCNIVSAIAFKYSAKVIETIGKKTVMYGCAITGIIYFIAWKSNSALPIILWPCIRIAIAIVNPFLNVSINKSIKGVNRATMLSVYNAIISVFVSVFDPFLGRIMDLHGVNRGMMMLSVVSLLTFILYFAKGKEFILTTEGQK